MKETILCIFIVATAVMLAGCESRLVPYKPAAGGFFGYSQNKTADDAYDVAFTGYNSTAYGHARDLALLRAAEIGRRLGYTHFIIEGEHDATEVREFSFSLPTRTTSLVGGVAPVSVTTYGSETVSETMRFPRPILRVRYYEGPPEGRHLEIFQVSRVIEDLCSRYEVALPAERPR